MYASFLGISDALHLAIFSQPPVELVLRQAGGFWVPDTGCWLLDAGCWLLDKEKSAYLGSRFSPAAGQKSGQFDRKRNSEKANVEGMNSAFHEPLCRIVNL